MQWEVCKLEVLTKPWDVTDENREKQEETYMLTRWCISSKELRDRFSDPQFSPKAGKDYEVNAEFIRSTWKIPQVMGAPVAAASTSSMVQC